MKVEQKKDRYFACHANPEDPDGNSYHLLKISAEQGDRILKDHALGESRDPVEDWAFDELTRLHGVDSPHGREPVEFHELVGDVGDRTYQMLQMLAEGTEEKAAIHSELLDFCPKSYWDGVDSQQLIRWIHAIGWYLNEGGCFPDILEDSEVSLDGSGRSYDDFADEFITRFIALRGKTSWQLCLYQFLAWASSRLVSLTPY